MRRLGHVTRRLGLVTLGVLPRKGVPGSTWGTWRGERCTLAARCLPCSGHSMPHRQLRATLGVKRRWVARTARREHLVGLHCVHCLLHGLELERLRGAVYCTRCVHVSRSSGVDRKGVTQLYHGPRVPALPQLEQGVQHVKGACGPEGAREEACACKGARARSRTDLRRAAKAS
eukprot:1256266-Rhodomonas_salina.4